MWIDFVQYHKYNGVASTIIRSIIKPCLVFLPGDKEKKSKKGGQQTLQYSNDIHYHLVSKYG